MATSFSIRRRLLLLVVSLLLTSLLFAAVAAYTFHGEYKKARTSAKLFEFYSDVVQLTGALREEVGLSLAVAMFGEKDFLSRQLSARNAVDQRLADVQLGVKEANVSTNYPELWVHVNRLITGAKKIQSQREHASDVNALKYTEQNYRTLIRIARRAARGIRVQTATDSIQEEQFAMEKISNMLTAMGRERLALMQAFYTKTFDADANQSFFAAKINQGVSLRSLNDIKLPGSILLNLESQMRATRFPELELGRELMERYALEKKPDESFSAFKSRQTGLDRPPGEDTQAAETTILSPVTWWDATTARYDSILRETEALTTSVKKILRSEANAKYANLLLLGILLGLTTLAAIIAAVAINRRLIGGISTLTRVMNEVSSTGDLSIKASIASDDEVGQIARSFNSFLQVNLDLSKHADQMSRGEIVPALKLRSDRDRLAKAMNRLAGSSEEITTSAKEIASGEYIREFRLRGDNDALGMALKNMRESLRDFQITNERQNWIREGQIGLNRLLSDDSSEHELARGALDFLAAYMDASCGTFFVRDEGEKYRMIASYAFSRRKGGSSCVSKGEGLVGQAVAEGRARVITDIPEGYFPISSSIGSRNAQSLVITPLSTGGKVTAVMEFAFLGDAPEQCLDLLNQVSEPLAIAILAALARTALNLALEETRKQAQELKNSEEALQSQSEELQSQAEELRASNEELQGKTRELENQSKRLLASEKHLMAQADELRQANEELDKKSRALEERTVLLDKSKRELEARTAEVEKASQYKTDFLANMSHELRTPLNSMLLLSRDLIENAEGHLDVSEVESATIIHESGSHLLQLINDILDLSRVESGRVELNIETVLTRSLGKTLQKRYAPIAREKELYFEFHTAEDIPEEIKTDRMRLEQIITNLISNALKFTDEGGIKVTFSVSSEFVAGEKFLCVAVADTGIGIPFEKLDKVFREFEQADGSTSRKYGGTGLGLAISRSMARLLGGDLLLESAVGVGSTFLLYLPMVLQPQTEVAPAGDRGDEDPERADPAAGSRDVDPSSTNGISADRPEAAATSAIQSHRMVNDDRQQMAEEGLPFILIVEDDPNFAHILLGIVRDKGLLGVVAEDGPQAVSIMKENQPIGLLLDISLPGADGWWVLSQIKKDPTLKHVPVHIVSGEDAQSKARKEGAIGYLKKPAEREEIEQAISSIQGFHDVTERRILVMEDDPDDQDLIATAIQSPDNELVFCSEIEAGLEELDKNKFHCIILDLSLNHGFGTQFLTEASKKMGDQLPPVVIHTGGDIPDSEYEIIEAFASKIIRKDAEMGALEDEVKLFLHSVQESGGVEANPFPGYLHDEDLEGKVILLVDDDLKNTFSLGRVLRKRGLRTLMAQSGDKAIKQLEDQKNNIDLVLMDIMMPNKDGYQTIREIRQHPEFQELPIIAVTAKAMADDRAHCLAVGANDYISKPVDLDKLLTMLRTWLF